MSLLLAVFLWFPALIGDPCWLPEGCGSELALPMIMLQWQTSGYWWDYAPTIYLPMIGG